MYANAADISQIFLQPVPHRAIGDLRIDRATDFRAQHTVPWSTGDLSTLAFAWLASDWFRITDRFGGSGRPQINNLVFMSGHG